MRLDGLTAEQKLELKQRILVDRNERLGEGTSYGELADADELVDDEALESEYGGTEFSPDDFSCSASAPKIWLVAEAVHLMNTASVYDYEDLSACARACATKAEAEKAVEELVRRFVDDFNADGCSTPEELESDFKAIMDSRDGDTWTHEYCDRSAVWRIIEGDTVPQKGD